MRPTPVHKKKNKENIVFMSNSPRNIYGQASHPYNSTRSSAVAERPLDTSRH